MDLQIYIDAARYAHIIAIAIGFGAAFLADYHVVSRLGRPIDDDLTTTLQLCHSVIWKMVFAMWVTGLVLVQIRTSFVPANFTPKLICKILTVAILTGNALLISKIAVPLVEQNRGRSLMWLPLGQKLRLAGIGAVSSASWMLALAMGSSKVLAASGWTVFAVFLPFIYFLGIFAAIAVMYLLHMGGQMMAHQPATLALTGGTTARRTPASTATDQTPTSRTPMHLSATGGQTANPNSAARLLAQRRAQDSAAIDRPPVSTSQSSPGMVNGSAARQEKQTHTAPDFQTANWLAAE